MVISLKMLPWKRSSVCFCSHVLPLSLTVPKQLMNFVNWETPFNKRTLWVWTIVRKMNTLRWLFLIKRKLIIKITPRLSDSRTMNTNMIKHLTHFLNKLVSSMLILRTMINVFTPCKTSLLKRMSKQQFVWTECKMHIKQLAITNMVWTSWTVNLVTLRMRTSNTKLLSSNSSRLMSMNTPQPRMALCTAKNCKSP